MATRQNIVPPNLVLAPKQYEQRYQDQLNNVQRLFYAGIANQINSPLPYGQFITTGSFTNTGTANQEKLVTFAIETDGFHTKLGDVKSRLYVAETGIYNVQFSAQCDLTSGSNKDIYFWLKQNGKNVPASAGVITVSSSAPQMAAWNWVLLLRDGDYIELAWSSSDTHAKLLGETGLTSPVRPDVPAVILTIVWVSPYNTSTGIS